MTNTATSTYIQIQIQPVREAYPYQNVFNALASLAMTVTYPTAVHIGRNTNTSTNAHVGANTVLVETYQMQRSETEN